MSQKKYFIEDFKVRNCTQYGEYEIINQLKSGDEVRIGYDSEEKNIFVEGPLRNEETKEVISWRIIGDVEASEQMRKILVPLLQGAYGSRVFICKINIADKKVVINERLQVSVWAANDEVGND